MPLTIAEISRLKMLSTAIFKKHICDSCGEDYYTIRENSKYCCSACRQMGYRKRVLDIEVVEEQPASLLEAEIEKVIAPKTKTDTSELEEKLRKYSINLTHIKNGK